MAFQIIWTLKADQDFYSIIIYLKENWSDLAAERLKKITLIKLDKIASMPYFPGTTSKANNHMIKLDRKNLVFFSIENQIMILLSIYPYKKDITKSKFY